ncbi:5'-nucleotidase C-terminal domain-containing protein [Actinomycetaceae bacterium MB13-C1-2]|nr:5'-nucleotidase C-terminal domain-containing protein [Actinomycetaceae bacterium MB13-C1-2]
MRKLARWSSGLSAAALVVASLTLAPPALAQSEVPEESQDPGIALDDQKLLDEQPQSDDPAATGDEDSQSDQTGSEEAESPALSRSTAKAAADLVSIQLLNINDFHGRISGQLDESKTALTGSSTMDFAYTVESLKSGGLADSTLLLSAGDNIGASLFASSLQNDEPTIKLLNALGLAASAVGNHEFDYGWDWISEVNGWAGGNWPYLAANVVQSDGSIPSPFQAYTVINSGSLKVGVIGVVTQETPALVSAGNTAGLTFLDPVDTVNTYADQLMALPEEQRPDIIVAEYHEGANEGKGSTLEQEMANSAVFNKIVTQTSPDVDAIFTGHTHKEYAWEAPVGDDGATRPIVQTGSYGANIGQVILQVDPETGKVASHTAQNVSTSTGLGIDVLRGFNPATATAYDIVLAAEQKADEEGSVVTGRIAATISRAFTHGDYVDGKFQTNSDSLEDRGSASPLGTLVSNMLRDQLSVLPDAPDFGVTNPGGLRKDLVYNPDVNGNITVAEANSILPFNNELATVKMTGDQVYTMLEQQWQRDASGKVPSRTFLYLGLSDNVRYTYHVIDDPVIPGAEKGIVDTVWIDGKLIDRAATYTVGTFNFLATAGDNFWVFNDTTVTNTGLLDYEQWFAYLASESGEAGIEPDFRKQGVEVDVVPSDATVSDEESVEVTYSNLNVHAIGAPENGDVTATLDLTLPVSATEPLVNAKDGAGYWSDSVAFELTVPTTSAGGDTTITMVAEPTGTTATTPAKITSDVVTLQLLNINDFHGRIDGSLNDAKDALTASSTMQFAYTIEELKNSGVAESSLLLSAGDNIGASLFASAIGQDKPTIDLLNALGLVASAVGNHEFDYGADWIDLVNGWANFPYLGANVIDDSTGKILEPFQPYVIVNSGGLRVAVIGTVTQETPTLVSKQNVEGLTFLDPVDTTNRYVEELMALPADQLPDVIVAEYHEGANEGTGSTLEQEMANSAIFNKIVTQTAPEVDAIFTGHTHKEYAWEAPVGDDGRTRPIVQTGSYGANIGQVLLDVDPATGEVVRHSAKNLSTASSLGIDSLRGFNSVTEAAYQIVLDAMKTADLEGSKPTGRLAATISRAYTAGDYVDGAFQKNSNSLEDRGGASPLGTLVSNMLRDELAGLEAAPDFGVTNPGGLRTDLVYDPETDGMITVAMARALLPFNNELSVVTMTGDQIYTMLEQQWQRTVDGDVPSRAFLYLGLSDNVRYTYHEIADPNIEGETLGVVDQVFIDGKLVDREGTYRAGTFTFLATGGDNFHVFAEAETLNTGLLDWEQWLNFLQEQSNGSAGLRNAARASEGIVPDFTKQGIKLDLVPANGTVKAGETVEATFSNINIHAIGAPENPTAEATLTTASGVLTETAAVSNVKDAETGVWSDSVLFEFKVPASTAGGIASLEMTASPTGSYATSFVEVVPVKGPIGPGKPGDGALPDTGVSVLWMVLAGLAVTATGAGLAVRSRREEV